jgi:hypothetical protein
LTKQQSSNEKSAQTEEDLNTNKTDFLVLRQSDSDAGVAEYDQGDRNGTPTIKRRQVVGLPLDHAPPLETQQVIL